MGVVLAISISLISGLLIAEFLAWSPQLSNLLLEIAVRRVPDSEKCRLREEWRAHLSEVPDGVIRIISTLGFVWSAGAISRELAPLQEINSDVTLDRNQGGHENRKLDANAIIVKLFERYLSFQRELHSQQQFPYHDDLLWAEYFNRYEAVSDELRSLINTADTKEILHYLSRNRVLDRELLIALIKVSDDGDEP